MHPSCWSQSVDHARAGRLPRLNLGQSQVMSSGLHRELVEQGLCACPTFSWCQLSCTNAGDVHRPPDLRRQSVIPAHKQNLRLHGLYACHLLSGHAINIEEFMMGQRLKEEVCHKPVSVDLARSEPFMESTDLQTALQQCYESPTAAPG